MNRLLWRLLLALLLLPLVAAVLLSFTGWGSKLVLSSAGRLLPLDIEYRAGTLAGELELERLAWSSDSLQLELTGLVLELAPGCLLHSSICFRQLYAQQVTLDLLPGPAGEEEQAPAEAAATLFEFPVPIDAPSLYLDALVIRWQGGEWRQGTLEGPVAVSGSTISVGRARVEQARLELAGGGESAGAVVLPGIKLPLELLVEELMVEGASWDMDGQRGELRSLKLAGQWRGSALELTRLELQAAALGRWQAAGDIDFSGQWPLTVKADGVLPDIQGWPAELGTQLAVSASGDLSELALLIDTAGELTLSAAAIVNTTAPELPFSLTVGGDWQGELALSALLEVPESLSSVAFTAPLQLAGSGDLKEQAFQLETTVRGLGYQPLALRLAGSHKPGRLELEDMRLKDSTSTNTLWGRGVLEYSEQIAWSAVLETSGLDLIPLEQYGSGRIEGQLQVQGSVDDGEWAISLDEADLKGTLNGLPARLSGYAGIDNRLVLLPSELEAELNGTRLSLQTSADPASAARLELALDDLGIWLPGSHGEIALETLLMPGWEEFSVTGKLRDIQWQGLRMSGGRIDGHYGPGNAGSGRLDIELADLSMAGFNLASLHLSGRGDASRQAVTLRSRGDLEGVVELKGGFADSGHWSGQLAPTTLQTGEGNWYLGEAVALDYFPAPSRLRLAAHCWQYQQARVCPGEALLAEVGNASLSLEGDLGVAGAFLPEYFELDGWVVGQVKADWSAGNPVVLDGSLHGRNLSFTRHFSGEESGTVTWENVDVRLRNGPQGLALNTAFHSEGSRVIGLDLGLPPDRGQQLTGTLDIAGLQLSKLAPFAPTLSVLEGELRGRLQLAGTVDQPLAQGNIQLSGGQFALLANPTELQQLDLQLDARGDSAVVSGRGMLGGGALSLQGTVMSRPEWRVELAIDGDRHEILLPPYTTMLVSEKLAMTLTGGLLDVEGDIVVLEGTLEHEQLPEGAVTLSTDVVEVDLEGNVIYESAPFDVSMQIGLLIKDKFKIVGDSVDATLGGDLRLRQRPRQPLQVFGNLNVVGGELRAYQQRLRITRGTLSFAGTPDNPELDVRAQREIASDNVVVGLQLQGTLNQPKLEVFSDPVMSHGETMSYLVRGRGLDTGASSDGVAMALSLGSSLVNQSALVTELNRIPGVNNIAFGAEGTNETDTAATVGGYIGERLYLSYGMGIYEPINVLTARLYLKTRLWLEVVSRLENSVDLYYSFDIK